MTFKDHFSGHAVAYASARPCYPAALYAWLAAQCVQRRLAWDAGCGNGQAALELAQHFERVVATDPSAPQIAQAAAHPRVAYRVEPAESPTLDDASVDLVTVAQALHWFDIEDFNVSARRVLAPGGVIAVWSYGLSLVEPAVDAVFMRLYDGVLNEFWPPERRLVERGYAGVAFPFDPIPPPPFSMQCEWTLRQFLDYLRTWSATQRYMAEHGDDPVLTMAAEFASAWGDPVRARTVHWPLSLRVGRRS